MEASHAVVLLKFLVWVWTALIMASLLLTFYRAVLDMYVTLFLLAAVLVPVLVMDSLFHGPGAIALGMGSIALVALVEMAFLIYNLIQATSKENFEPLKDALVPFILLMVFAFARMIVAYYLIKLFTIIRHVPFEERCKVKSHTV